MIFIKVTTLLPYKSVFRQVKLSYYYVHYANDIFSYQNYITKSINGMQYQTFIFTLLVIFIKRRNQVKLKKKRIRAVKKLL